MSAEGFGDFFVTDDGVETPAPMPSAPVQPAPDARPATQQPNPAPAPAVAPATPVAPAAPGTAPIVPQPVPASVPVVSPQPVQAPVVNPQPAQAPVPVEGAPAVAPPAGYTVTPAASSASPARHAAPAPVVSREQQLAAALDHLMTESLEIEASALVSLDGFTMASALPESMHEDRVGAMSAAILGLGERAAAELGRGRLSQVFIEGESGFVLLMAAGEGAVLTCLAAPEAKLGLVIYDMRVAAERISEILA